MSEGCSRKGYYYKDINANLKFDISQTVPYSTSSKWKGGGGRRQNTVNLLLACSCMREVEGMGTVLKHHHCLAVACEGSGGGPGTHNRAPLVFHGRSSCSTVASFNLLHQH